jgi:hypothetical protein
MEEEECRAEERQESEKEDSAGSETDAGVTEERECRVGDRDKSRGWGVMRVQEVIEAGV